MRILLLIIELTCSQIAFCQSVDTLHFLVRKSKMEDNFHYGEYKMLLLANGEILKNTAQIKKMIVNKCVNTPLNAVFIYVYKRKNRMLCSGLWNEEGFLNEVTFYKRNRIKSIVHFQNKDDYW